MSIMYQGVAYSESSEMGKELAKHQRCGGTDKYPMMLYKAQKRHNGSVACMEDTHTWSPLLTDAENERMHIDVDAFNRSCQMTVRDEDEHKRFAALGWADSPKAAKEVHERFERAFGDEAARLAHADRNLSEKAKAEKEAFEATTHEHVAVVPEQRAVKIDGRSKAGRAAKSAAVAA